MSNKKIAVIGGDMRQTVVAALLAEDGFECAAYGFERYTETLGGATLAADLIGALKEAAAVILPLPYSGDRITVNTPLSDRNIKMTDILSLSDADTIFLGGMIDERDFVGRRVFDYYDREELKLLNAVPTAEGALAIAMEELPVTIHGVKALVLGYGRIGKVLAYDLKALGAQVCVASRSEKEKAWCEITGVESLGYEGLEKRIGDFELIFNTVPARILEGELLRAVKEGVPIIDLATKPGGVDFGQAKELGKNVIWALSLPGKVAPISAGKIIKKSVCNILEKEGII